MSIDKVPVPYFETVGPDGKKIYKPKQWIERFRQYIKRTEKIDIIELINEQPVTIAGWESKPRRKSQRRISMGTRTECIKRNDKIGIR